MYADGTCIIAPSSSALHELLDICADFSVLNLVFNDKKDSVYVSNQIHWIACSCLLSALLVYLWLSWQLSNTHFGVIIHDKHQDDDDIRRYVKSLYSIGMICLSGASKQVPPVLKLFR